MLWILGFLSSTLASRFYGFEALTIDHKTISMDQYRGNVTIVVNVATN
jgi:glutathione peroxidase-family protein